MIRISKMLMSLCTITFVVGQFDLVFCGLCNLSPCAHINATCHDISATQYQCLCPKDWKDSTCNETLLGTAYDSNNSRNTTSENENKQSTPNIDNRLTDEQQIFVAIVLIAISALLIAMCVVNSNKISRQLHAAKRELSDLASVSQMLSCLLIDNGVCKTLDATLLGGTHCQGVVIVGLYCKLVKAFEVFVRKVETGVVLDEQEDRNLQI
ncbi:uncharacterized protein TRIADDRAFT_62468 [Trichoplax adhaerens]|uniref:EGF-like domain-containing protein n=1 Tax=Trichoplax adhaerens TaxID=10228 RepID=B3SDW3_TRIAD|nr:predicted protein [Trichoplax adhaerens]EDV19083.1 predicted protein [Trichoplax adhaerens]|eukprot:XP_002118432.1 predicted protein [Trichoplax adhaerens]